MPAHFLSRLCAIAAAGCLLPGAAQAQATQFSSAPSIVSQGPCYTETALNTLLAKRPADNADAEADPRNQIRMRYEENVRRFHQQLDCIAFTYKVDGLTVDGHMVKPKRTDGRKLPVLVYNRGGNIRTGPLSLRELVNDQMQWADGGYLVISSQYRGIGHDEYGGRDVNDVMALFPIIDGIPEADPERIGMIGFSRGSIMTYLAAARSQRIKAIAIWGGVSDMRMEVTRRPEMDGMMATMIPDYATNREQALKDRSVIYWMDRIQPKLPVLLLHGEADVRVVKENAIRMGEKLKEREQPYKLVIYPNGDHALTTYRNQVRNELMGWFKQYL